MKRLLKVLIPPGVIAVPVLLFALLVNIYPFEPEIPIMGSAAEKRDFVLRQERETRIAKVGWAGIAVAVTTASMIFFLPAIIAGFRDAPSYIGILIVNVVGGPFLIGWIAALIWAFVDRKPDSVVVQDIYQSPPPPLN